MMWYSLPIDQLFQTMSSFFLENDDPPTPLRLYSKWVDSKERK